MEWLISFGTALGGAAIPTALFLFILDRQSTTIGGIKSDVKTKVSAEDCGRQPCEDVETVKEVLQGKMGEVGMVGRLQNIETIVKKIYEHQVNGGPE